ncbi:hypothetical protein PPL_11569 [Heterostelium album PN500]|uniref:Uncharacterized protein n=1 Tax=Heterostelium pallidum (strain ATCC 26659 / Pp 5 / PN500) TaxID=670386 RepID=D3BVH8_HETP5|nr:hypothetical protein PPL_11569 [Heterostelium album PN500]EFA74601.1 hypothetical protein PPL_11569 [Heterostelium album PN500]|eukprot:XP_020426735.1 hypothetical protein PPL_11569 [Heterostelium album PN500]
MNVVLPLTQSIVNGVVSILGGKKVVYFAEQVVYYQNNHGELIKLTREQVEQYREYLEVFINRINAFTSDMA